MRVALVHYWLVGMRGGEKVLEALCRLFPEADIFTLFYKPDRVSETIRTRRVTASFLNPLRRFHRTTLPLMPLALEQFDLRGYDLILSSESGPAKGVLAGASARHLCYCHSPMRYIWELYPAYMESWVGGPIKRALFAPMASYLRLWDFASAARVDHFVANSHNVQQRIRRAYGRESTVVYPPVAVESFYGAPAGDYFLIVSALVEYKQLDYAVRLFSRTGRRLKIVGEGPDFRRLKAMAGDTVEFCGFVSEPQLRDLYARSRALIMPGEEDFGMVTVEAFASGKPVIALGKGGVLEVAGADSPASVLYQEATGEALARALEDFEKRESNVDAAALQAIAAGFSEAAFADGMRREIARVLRDDRDARQAGPAARGRGGTAHAG